MDIIYPQVAGLPDQEVQEQINRLIMRRYYTARRIFRLINLSSCCKITNVPNDKNPALCVTLLVFNHIDDKGTLV